MDELFRVLFGLDPMTSGQIVVRDEPQRPTTPLAAMRRGWALIPESRREQGLMMDWSIARNTTLLVLDKLLSRLGLIDKRQVRSTTDQYIRRLGIATRQPGQESRQSQRWQPTESAFGQMAGDRSGHPDSQRSDARSRCRRKMGDLRALPATRGPGHDHLDDLERGRGGPGPGGSRVRALERQSAPRVSTRRSHEGGTPARHGGARTDRTRCHTP